jgi:hypothetical protein
LRKGPVFAGVVKWFMLAALCGNGVIEGDDGL